MWWSRTSAAAVIAPIRHGQRLTRRSALKLVLSRELPRSAGALTAACSRLTQRSSAVSGRSAECLTGVVNRALAFVAQVGQGGVIGVGPLGQGRQRLGMG